MADDEAIALYGAVKKMAEAMAAREAVLDAKTAALDHAIAELKGLPLALGKQTSQYIAMGVRQSIQDDFSRPIGEAFNAPIAELKSATYHARSVMAEVGKEARFQNWRWISIMVLLGIVLGATGCYYWFVHDLNRINDRLDTIQQQITPAVPAPVPQPTDGKAAKDHRRR
jgi:hypothetical protein